MHLRPVSKADNEGWATVEVEARVSGFMVHYTACLMLGSLVHFNNSLREMQDAVG